ncbi:MAG: hypothetical protein ACRYGM_02820 [Janthinobacterium lividum]|jgi:hypothetical protein
METTPRFINGVHGFTGQGLETALPLGAPAYTVPSDRRAQPIYIRAGNSTAEMVAVMLMHDGKAIRTFPVGAKAGIHVPLAVVEDLQPDSVMEIYVAAPQGVSGQIVLDFGLLEI